jgi:transcriptional regulator with XRE-family HTH domain
LTTPSAHARQALGARLREIRRDSGLTGRALADACGWHFTKVSKLEHGTQNPSDDDLRAWCRVCEAGDRLDDLLATVRAIESMYVEWRRALRFGMAQNQRARIALYERTALIRNYESGVIPGLLQTAGYANAVIAASIELRGLPDDRDEAVAARLERQRFLYAGDRRYVAVLEEQALRTHVGGAEIMHGQLDRLLAVMSLPRVSLGVIPSMALRTVWPSAGFWIFDRGTVRVETPSAELTITQRGEIAEYEKRFDRLQESAVHGHAARTLIHKALADLTPIP